MATPRTANMLYSIHENGISWTSSSCMTEDSRAASSVFKGSYSSAWERPNGLDRSICATLCPVVGLMPGYRDACVYGQMGSGLPGICLLG